MKKDQLKILIVACLIVAVCGFAYATYAFFQTTFTGTATATLAAEWSFDFLGKDSGEYQSLKGTTYTIDLAKSCTNCADVTVEGNTTKKLQPGSQGSFMVKVDASSSSVKTNANVVMYNLTVGGNSTIPAGLRFYVLDGASERTLTTNSLTTGSGVSIYSNTWEADAANKTGEQTVYWAWDYAAANDNAFQGKTINFALKAEAEQATE